MRKTYLIPIALAVLLATPAFAADSPIPPGANHVARSVEDVTAFDIAMTPSRVDAFYRKALAQRGWTAGDSVNYGTSLVIDFHKAPKAVGRVTITPKGNNLSHVTLSLLD